jgi:hypothetical protein
MAFHFYQVKPINEILVGNYDSTTCIELNDLRTLIDDTEFLRRVYFYRTLTGRSEIDHRIKLCAGNCHKTQTSTRRLSPSRTTTP